MHLRVLLLSLVVAALGVHAAERLQWGSPQSFHPFANTPALALSDNVALMPLPVGEEDFSFVANGRTLRKGCWGLAVADSARSLIVSVAETDLSHPLGSKPAIVVSVGGTAVAPAKVEIDKSPGRDISLRLSRHNGQWLVEAGSTKLEIIALPIAANLDISRIGFAASGHATLHRAALHYNPRAAIAPSPWQQAGIDSLYRHLRLSTDAMEGIYEYLDRNMDEALMQPGGTYRVALVKDESSGSYTILYLGGATIDSHRWQPGMVKAQMTPSPDKAVFRLTWLDASMQELDGEAVAVLEDPSTLTLQFPYYDSTVRLRRIPLPYTP